MLNTLEQNILNQEQNNKHQFHLQATSDLPNTALDLLSARRSMCLYNMSMNPQ